MYYGVGVLVVILATINLPRINKPRIFHPGKSSEATSDYDFGRFAPILIGALLSTLAAVRYDVGSDYSLYVDLFARINPDSLLESTQSNPQSYTYAVLQFLIRQFTSQPMYLLGLSAAIPLLTTFWAFKRLNLQLSSAVYVYYFLGFYALSLNAVRQSISVGILFLAITYKEKSKPRFYTLAFLAGTFHSSAFIALLIYLVISNLSFNKRNVTLLTITVLAIGVFTNLDIVKQFLSVFGPRYETHLNSEPASTGTWMNISIKMFIFLLILYFIGNKGENNKINMYLYFGILVLALALTANVIGRLEPYFSIFFTVAISKMPTDSNGASICRKVIFLLLFVYFGFYVTFYNEVVPYQSLLL